MTSAYQPIKRRDPDEPEPLTPGARQLWKTIRDSNCQLCVLGQTKNGQTTCMIGNGAVPALGMVVTDVPNVVDDRLARPLTTEAGQYLEHVFKDMDVDPSQVYVTHAVKCAAPRENRDKILEQAVKACVPFLEAEIAAVKPKAILAMGATPYYFFAHKKGIMKQRGQAFFHERFDCWIVPTVSPTYVMINPAYDAAFNADVAMFRRYMLGQTTDPPVDIVYVNTLEDWYAAEAELNEDEKKTLTFDLETRGFKDFDQQGKELKLGINYSQVWCVALTRGRRGPNGMRVFVVPLEHPDSPFLANSIADWQDNWSARPLGLRMADEYRPVYEGVYCMVKTSRVSGHNVKYDLRNIEQLARRYGLEDPCQ